MKRFGIYSLLRRNERMWPYRLHISPFFYFANCIMLTWKKKFCNTSYKMFLLYISFYIFLFNSKVPKIVAFRFLFLKFKDDTTIIIVIFHGRIEKLECSQMYELRHKTVRNINVFFFFMDYVFLLFYNSTRTPDRTPVILFLHDYNQK